MKYVVTLNGKNYEVDVTETDAIVTGITEVPVMVAAAPAVAPVAAPAEAPKAEETPAAPAAAPAAEVGEEDMVAIAYALHTFYNMHDEESDVLTIHHEGAAYSPWNQKSITF